MATERKETPPEPKVLMTGKDGQPRMVPESRAPILMMKKGFTLGYKAPKEVKQSKMSPAAIAKMQAENERLHSELEEATKPVEVKNEQSKHPN